jgi:hypothetical protein
MQNITRRLAMLGLSLLLAACAAPVSRVDVGEVTVGKRLAVKVDAAWNQFGGGLTAGVPTWTMEGITIDALRFYTDIKDGQTFGPANTPKGRQPLVFKAGMQAADIVALFQSLQTQDGSSFTLDKLEPVEFLGGTGFRFEYSAVRKVDEVPLKGMAYGRVREGELFLVSYSAPRLVFFPRYQPRVENLIKSVSLRS